MEKKILEGMSEKELLKRKRRIERNIKVYFNNLVNFVENSGGDIDEIYGTLEGNYNRALNDATLLNEYLSDEDKINAFEYTESHKILVEKTEAKNKDYVKGLCKQIMDEKTPEERDDRAGISKEPLVILEVTYHGVNPVGYD